MKRAVATSIAVLALLALWIAARALRGQAAERDAAPSRIEPELSSQMPAQSRTQGDATEEPGAQRATAPLGPDRPGTLSVRVTTSAHLPLSAVISVVEREPLELVEHGDARLVDDGEWRALVWEPFTPPQRAASGTLRPELEDGLATFAVDFDALPEDRPLWVCVTSQDECGEHQVLACAPRVAAVEPLTERRTVAVLLEPRGAVLGRVEAGEPPLLDGFDIATLLPRCRSAYPARQGGDETSYWLWPFPAGRHELDVLAFARGTIHRAEEFVEVRDGQLSTLPTWRLEPDAPVLRIVALGPDGERVDGDLQLELEGWRNVSVTQVQDGELALRGDWRALRAVQLRPEDRRKYGDVRATVDALAQRELELRVPRSEARSSTTLLSLELDGRRCDAGTRISFVRRDSAEPWREVRLGRTDIPHGQWGDVLAPGAWQLLAWVPLLRASFVGQVECSDGDPSYVTVPLAENDTRVSGTLRVTCSGVPIRAKLEAALRPAHCVSGAGDIGFIGDIFPSDPASGAFELCGLPTGEPLELELRVSGSQAALTFALNLRPGEQRELGALTLEVR